MLALLWGRFSEQYAHASEELMDAKHTPGPWHLEGDRIEADHRHSLLPVATVYRSPGDEAEDAANAALLAAAPELLASLREVLEIARGFIEGDRLLRQEREAFADAQDLVERLASAQKPHGKG